MLPARNSLIAISVLAVFSIIPLIASAAVLGPGCRTATAEDQSEMADRGLPKSFEVCPQDEKILGIGENFDQWYTQIKAMSPCNKNTCTLSCRTRNTGAQVCGPTATRWNSIGCNPSNNNIAIFPSVSYGFAAHIELLRRYCGERGRCTIASAIQQWAPAADGNNPATYAAFVSRAAGIPANQVYNPNDIDLMGRLAMAMSCLEAGSLPYSADDLKQGLIMAGGGARVPVPANVGELLNESLTGSYSANPVGSPNAYPQSWAYPPSSVSGNTYAPPIPPSNPLPVIQPSNSTPSGQTSTSPGGTQGAVNTNAYTAALQSAALLFVQPALVHRGDPALVSWSSVGMDPQSVCQVSAAGQTIAQKNSGSQILPTTVSEVGSLAFTLSCTTLAGARVQQNFSIQVI